MCVFQLFIIYTYSNICSTWFHKCSPPCIKRTPAHGPAFVEDSVFLRNLFHGFLPTPHALALLQNKAKPVAGLWSPSSFVLFSHCAVLSKEWTGTGHQDVLSGLLRATSNN